jgi:hypothetical protein
LQTLVSKTPTHRFRKLPDSKRHAVQLSFATAILLSFGACSVVETECPYDKSPAARNAALPVGCTQQGVIGGQVRRVSCVDGRTGFSFQ